jgi:hypothetical protein
VQPRRLLNIYHWSNKLSKPNITPADSKSNLAIADDDALTRFSNWKAYPLPPLNNEGRFDADWLHREFVAFKAGGRTPSAESSAVALLDSRPLHAARVASDEPNVDASKLYFWRFGWNAYRDALAATQSVVATEAQP